MSRKKYRDLSKISLATFRSKQDGDKDADENWNGEINKNANFFFILMANMANKIKK